MLLYQRFIPGLAIASYIVGDEKSGEAAVIDPTRDVEDYIRYAWEHDLHIRHIIETHVHADFVSGARDLKARLNNEPIIHCSEMGGKEWLPSYVDERAKEGDRIDIGAIRLEVVHTPGHTPEHISIALYDTKRSTETPWLMFTGDFLFVGDVGRPDLMGEETRQDLAHELYKSVFDRIAPLLDMTEIFPAHGAGSLCGKAIGSRRSSTLGFERLHNSAMQKKSEKDWVDDLLEGMPPSPPYFKRMKKVNIKGPAIIGPELPGLKRWSARKLHEILDDKHILLDVRSKEAFAGGHIPRAINIPLADTLSTWAGWVLPYDCPIMIVADKPSQIVKVVTHLLRIGFDDVQGYLEGGMEEWENAGLPLDTLRTMTVHELSAALKRGATITVLDVRTESEWNEGHVEGALNIHAGLLQDHMDKVPRDKPIAVVCGSGYRATIASSLLKRNGFADVSNVLGGMTAWKSAKLPTV
jgi:hydroxyacylglutathione hydrolase